ncbi:MULTISPECIES: hypothetical protein [unclassified Streptomyces]|uniref:hypothetical protein n=1 Tax=unclassified Streptomyces TaxID=2593676 RepID=UPI00365106CA
MNLPDDGDERSTAHLRELELFLSVHLGRAPGVLWPEYDNPAFGRGDAVDADDAEDAVDGAGIGDGDGGKGPANDGARAAARLEAFTGRLGALTGLVVRAELVDAGAHARLDPRATDAASTDHLLIHQIDGAVTWRLTGPGEDGEPASFQCRLLPGEVLYVPTRWDRRAECARGIRYAVVSLHRAGE